MNLYKATLLLLILITPLRADTIYNLIKIPNLEVYKISAQNKLRYLNAIKPFRLGVNIKKNIRCYNSDKKTLNKKYPRDDRGTIHGNIISGVHPQGTHYFVSGYKSYGDLLESDRSFRINNPNYMKDRLKMNKDVDWDTFKRVRKFTRVLVKKW